MPYATPEGLTGPYRNDDSQFLLYKIAAYLAKALIGETALSTRPYQRATAPSNAAVATAAGTTFTLAAGETGFIRNLGTNPIFVKYGAGASSSDFTDVLAAGTGADNGTGAAIIIEDWIGAVSVAGTSPRFMAWKR